MNHVFTSIPLMIVLSGITGCHRSDSSDKQHSTAPLVRTADSSTTIRLTPDELRRKLRANELAKFQYSGNDIVRAELYQSGVKSIEALRGVPLRYLDLGMTENTDLSPLEGMPLTELILENTPVSDISVLRGMPLKQLNLMNIPIQDLSLVAGMTSLKRLNIADTLIEDLTPLKQLKLERLTFSPDRMHSGIDVIRRMSSLAEIQPSIDNPMTAAEFWKRYDLGLWNNDPNAGEGIPEND